MIVYSRTKEQFISDVFTNNIDEIIQDHLYEFAGKRVGQAELNSFKNSLSYMDRILNTPTIPDKAGISIEYHIPQTSKRIDFIISGTNGQEENVVIIELKQWSSCSKTNMEGIVNTFVGGGNRNVTHPSYQAYSYAAILKAFNATVEEESINLLPCAYLHNYDDDDQIKSDFYEYYLDKAPVFLKSDAGELRNYIGNYIKEGDLGDIIRRIEHGKIRPTKSLADSLKRMLKGNKEFVMIDDQKVVYETALRLVKESNPLNKNVLIVEGGPGTGKSVVAINLLVELNRMGMMSQYVTKTSAPRDVYFQKLIGDYKKVELKSLFVGSGAFMNPIENNVKALIVDEAHRLNEKTGFLNQGDNQIREIITSAEFSVFFIDENQMVHIKDYGEINTIVEIAEECGTTVHQLALESQFRCNGSDGYLAWVDNLLQIRETANVNLQGFDYDFDFKVMDNPAQLRDIIYEKNEINNKARIVAGYCWDWVSKKKPEEFDIVFDEYDFKMQWNMTDYGGTWIINPESVTEVGCIHTAQGLEVDYIGVIIGKDLIYRNGEVLVDPAARSGMDRTIFGHKKMMRENPESAAQLLERIIKNTYRTLMTRGMKGCYVYCMDQELADYFRKMS